MLAPVAPHIAEELWTNFLGKSYSVHQQSWPKVDEAAAKEDAIEIPVQINGKVRDRVTLPSDVSEKVARTAVHDSEKTIAALEGMQVIKEIYVPGRLMNFVVKPK